VLAIGAGAGALNAAMNALVLARLDGRPGAFVRFHAWWNVGVLLGAGLAGAVLSADLSHRFAWAGIGFATVALSPLVGRVAVPAAVRATRAPFRLRAVLASPRMAALATLFFAATAVEASLDVWGVLSLRERLGATPALGASAYAIGQVLAVVSRAVLGPLLARAGARRAAAVGAGSAAAGSVLQATAPSPVVAGAGLAVAVMGIALCGPLLLAHAGARSARPAPTVAALTAAALAGGVVGPPLVGVVADVLGVRAGLLTVAVVAAAMAGVLRLTGPPGWVRVGPR
jgi:MFS family permease